jgi:hypothetical protein
MLFVINLIFKNIPEGVTIGIPGINITESV